jgi:activator of HSP90 ATPase
MSVGFLESLPETTIQKNVISKLIIIEKEKNKKSKLIWKLKKSKK